MFPDIHYMVNVDSRTEQLIQGLILQHKYFTINCARQYGKTTILNALYQKLKLEYSIFFLNFEDMGSAAFSDEYQFCKAFLHLMKAQIAYGMTQGISEITVTQMERDMERENFGQAFNRVWGCRSQKGHYCGAPSAFTDRTKILCYFTRSFFKIWNPHGFSAAVSCA